MLKLKLAIPRLRPPPPPPPPASPPNSSSSYVHHILTLVKQCTSVRCFKQIHAHMLTCCIHKPNHLLAKLLLLHDLPYSLLLFSQNPRPNDFSFNLLIRALATLYVRYPLALHFYLLMIRSGHRPNHYTFPFVLLSAVNLQSLYHGLTAHASVFKLGLHDNDHVQHSMITMYARCGEVGCARKVFDEIVERDLVSWNSMLSGYAKMGCAAEAVELFRRMKEEGLVEPNEVTLVCVLVACGNLGDVSLGLWLEGLVEEYGLVLNSFLGSALIDMYSKCGDLESARRVFDGLAKKDLVAWNAMITGQVST